MTRFTAVLLSLLFLSVAAPRAFAGATVDESAYRTYRSLQYAEALRDARKMWARGNKAKLAAAEAELTQTFAAAGWTRDRFSEVDDAIGEVHSNLSSAKSGDISAEDLKSALAECDPVTVATVKAHLDELNNTGDQTRAEKQVRDELDREQAGVPPTDPQLAGTWVFDADATLDAMLGEDSSPDRAKLKAEMEAKTGKPSYTFGPGNAVVVRSKSPDGADKVEKALYRLDGNKVIFKSEGRSREESLQIGLRGGKLILGTGFGRVAFSRQ